MLIWRGWRNFEGFFEPFLEDGLVEVEVSNISIRGSHFWVGAEVKRQPPLVIGVHRAQ